LNKQIHINHREAADLELLQSYKSSKSLQVLGELYGRYIHLVYGVALKYLKNRVEAQDVTMQVFEQLVDKVLKHEIENFKSWLHVLTRNHCLMQLRSSKHRLSNDVIDIEQVNVENEQLMHHTDDKPKLEEQITKLEHCIQRLKDEQKQCVELFYLQQKSYKEIEEKTQLPLKKVKSHIQNGKRNLKICIESSE